MTRITVQCVPCCVQVGRTDTHMHVTPNALSRYTHLRASAEEVSVMSTTPLSAPLLLSVEEAAAQIRVGRARMFDLIRRGKVVSVKVGGSRRVPYDSLRAYVDQLITEQAPGGPANGRPAA
jgi:excisionase family DNA binding protein